MLHTTAGMGCASRRAHPSPPASAGRGPATSSVVVTPPQDHRLLGLGPLLLPLDLELPLLPDHRRQPQSSPPHRLALDLDQPLLAVVPQLDDHDHHCGVGLRMGSLGSILPDKKLIRIFIDPSIEDPHVPLATKFGADARGLVVDEGYVSLRHLIAVERDTAVRVHQRRH